MTSYDRSIPRSELIEQLRELGVRDGGILLVHTSFRAVRPVDAGPLGLIAHTCRVTYPDGSPNQNLCTAPTEVLFQDVRVWKI